MSSLRHLTSNAKRINTKPTNVLNSASESQQPSVKNQLTVTGYYKKISSGAFLSGYRVYQIYKRDREMYRNSMKPTWKECKERRSALRDLNLTLLYMIPPIGASFIMGFSSMLSLAIYPFIWKVSGFNPKITPSYASTSNTIPSFYRMSDIDQKAAKYVAEHLVGNCEINSFNPSVMQKWELFKSLALKWTDHSCSHNLDENLVAEDVKIILHNIAYFSPFIGKQMNTSMNNANFVKAVGRVMNVKPILPVGGKSNTISRLFRTLTTYKIYREYEETLLYDRIIYDRDAVIELDDVKEILNHRLGMSKRSIEKLPETQYSFLINAYLNLSIKLQNSMESSVVQSDNEKLVTFILMKALISSRTS